MKATCPAILHTDAKTSDVVCRKNKHSHPSDNDAIDAATAETQMKFLATTTGDKPAAIVLRVKKVLPKKIKARLPNDLACKKTIRRLQSKTRSQQPTSQHTKSDC